MDRPQRTAVAIATYNERDSLPPLVDAIRAALPEARIVVVDDNSPDGTGRWCDARAAHDDHLHVLHRGGKLGLGSATITAFRWALAQGHELIATMDADGSHAPESLPDLVRLAGEVDVAIGSRYCPGGRIEGWPLSRRLISRLLNRLSSRLLRVPAADLSGAFRVYRASALQRIDLEAIGEPGYAYLEEILWRLHRAGATLGEAPIVFRDRQQGKSKAGLDELRGKLRMLGRLSFAEPPEVR